MKLLKYGRYQIHSHRHVYHKHSRFCFESFICDEIAEYTDHHSHGEIKKSFHILFNYVILKREYDADFKYTQE